MFKFHPANPIEIFLCQSDENTTSHFRLPYEVPYFEPVWRRQVFSSQWICEMSFSQQKEGRWHCLVWCSAKHNIQDQNTPSSTSIRRQWGVQRHMQLPSGCKNGTNYLRHIFADKQICAATFLQIGDNGNSPHSEGRKLPISQDCICRPGLLHICLLYSLIVQ